MTPTRSARTPFPSHASRRLRPANPTCRGGASSVLRLTQPAAARLPAALDLSDWMDRAASVLMPVTGPIGEFRSHAGVARA